MTELPTRAQIFANCLGPLDTARGSLSEVRDWLRSDWQPIDAALTPRPARPARRVRPYRGRRDFCGEWWPRPLGLDPAAMARRLSDAEEIVWVSLSGQT
jgi:hypothetical protein